MMYVNISTCVRYVLTEIIDMMECTTESFTVCLAAYKECKNNVQAAMTLLTDDAAKSRLNEQGRKRRAEQKSSKKGFLANLFNSSNAGVPSEVKTLMRSVNVTEPIARLAHDLYTSQFPNSTLPPSDISHSLTLILRECIYAYVLMCKVWIGGSSSSQTRRGYSAAY